jgi:hypothetical protein
MVLDVAQVAALIDQGLSSQEVAAAIGTTRTRVIRLVHQHGIQLAPGGCRRAPPPSPRRAIERWRPLLPALR